jgi:RecA-family ATPase
MSAGRSGDPAVDAHIAEWLAAATNGSGADPTSETGHSEACDCARCVPVGAAHGTGTAERPQFRCAKDVMDDPRPVAVIQGIAWRRAISVLVSESGVGKTFVVLDAAVAVSEARPWHGRRVRQGSVAYCSFEGDALGLRLQALHEAGRDLTHVHVINPRAALSPQIERDGTEKPSAGELLVAEALAELATRVAMAGAPPIRLLVADTVRASMTGSEDDSAEVSAYLRVIRRLIAPYPEAAALLVHHAGWQDGEARRRRERGSSAWRGNADATLYLEVAGENIELGTADLVLTALKVRDDHKPAPLHLIRSRVTLSTVDEDGRPHQTCRIESDSRTREDREAEETQQREATQATLDQRAYDLIAKHSITSMETLRNLLGKSMEATRGAVARLEVAKRIHRPAQRAPWVVGPRPTQSDSCPTSPSGVDADRESDRPPPLRGRSDSSVRRPRRRHRAADESDRPSRGRSEANLRGGGSPRP